MVLPRPRIDRFYQLSTPWEVGYNNAFDPVGENALYSVTSHGVEVPPGCPRSDWSECLEFGGWQRREGAGCRLAYLA